MRNPHEVSASTGGHDAVRPSGRPRRHGRNV